MDDYKKVKELHVKMSAYSQRVGDGPVIMRVGPCPMPNAEYRRWLGGVRKQSGLCPTCGTLSQFGVHCQQCRSKSKKYYYATGKSRYAVAKAVVQGRLPHPKTLTCECGQPAAEYHHPDYDEPLGVVPVCFICHRKTYRRSLCG